MRSDNVSERMQRSPRLGVSIVILTLGCCTAKNGQAVSCADGDQKAIGTYQKNQSSIHGSCRRELWLPLVKRIREPFKGAWALPGGELKIGRSLEQSALDALESTTRLRPKYLEQLHTFGDPGRSHTGLPTVSIVYWALVEPTHIPLISGEENVQWFPESELPDLAFDHGDIIAYALRQLRHKVAYPDIVTKLVGEEFTLGELHSVYQAVTQKRIDLPNFRRKMHASGELEKTGKQRKEGRQRPAALYRYRAHEHC